MRDVTAPMPGKIIEVKVEVGAVVNENDELLILESMKMNLPIVAPASGTVKEVKCKKGDIVKTDEILMVIE